MTDQYSHYSATLAAARRALADAEDALAEARAVSRDACRALAAAQIDRDNAEATERSAARHARAYAIIDRDADNEAQT